jgi:N-acetyl-alpha-D-glucosaminyl L-malate synthase BshA
MSTSLSIGVVCFASLGGSGIVASELAAGLAARGHRVHVIASAPPTRPLPANPRLAFHAVPVTEHPVLGQPLYGLALAETIVGVCRRTPLDVLHVHYAVPHAASAFLAGATLGAAAPRVVTTLHGSDVTSYGLAQSYDAVTRFSVRASDGLTVPSDFLRREAVDRLGLGPDAAIEVIPNSVDTTRFAPVATRDPARFDRWLAARPSSGTAGPVLVHVSNFRTVKRVPDLIDVLARVRRTLPARLVLVGDGPERAPVEALARERGLADAVAFAGPRPDVADDLPHADAFLLPSATESFGVAALEAMSAGVPVVAYRVGGLPDVVGDTGALVAPFDGAAYADAVLAIVGDPARRAVLGTAARARAVERFDRARTLDRWEAYFGRVLASPRTAVA